MYSVKFKYTEIKETYIEVKKFLEYASGEKINSLNTKIVDDLNIWGDENYFLLIEFIEKYDLNFAHFRYDEHFDSEGDFVGLGILIFGLLTLPISIINSFIIKHISLNAYNNIGDVIYGKANEKKDLTFGDLITSKLKGEFCLRDEYRIELVK